MPDTISFARGAPSPDLIPVEAVRKATAKALEDDWKTALSYGVGIGHPGLCAWIADRHGLPEKRRSKLCGLFFELVFWMELCCS